MTVWVDLRLNNYTEVAETCTNKERMKDMMPCWEKIEFKNENRRIKVIIFYRAAGYLNKSRRQTNRTTVMISWRRRGEISSWNKNIFFTNLSVCAVWYHIQGWNYSSFWVTVGWTGTKRATNMCSSVQQGNVLLQCPKGEKKERKKKQKTNKRHI